MKHSGWADRLASVFRGTPTAQEPVEAIARRAMAHLDAGAFDDACAAFREATNREPDNAAHLVNLAYALQQTDAHELALLHLQRAVALAPDSFDAHYKLAGALERDGEPVQARAHLEEALALRPGHAPAHADLSRLLLAAGDAAGAKSALLAGLAVDAADPDLLLAIGKLCLAQQEPEAARAHLLAAARLSPGSPAVWAHLGRACQSLNAADEALRHFDRALDIAPDAPDVLLDLAMALRDLGRLAEAESHLRRGLALRPDDPDLHNGLGMVLAEQMRPAEAEACYLSAIALGPDRSGAYGNLGLLLHEQGRLPECITLYRKSLSIKPAIEVHGNLGLALMRVGEAAEAIEQLRRALELQPGNPDTLSNLAAAIAAHEGYAAGIRAYREVLALHPGQLGAHSNLLHYMSVDPSTSAAEYLAEAARFDAKLPRAERPAPAAPADGARPLRVGLVSGDFQRHPVGYFLDGVMPHLARSGMALWAYSTVGVEDELTSRLRPHFTGWRCLAGLGDEAAASLIRADGIDILIDLSGHTRDTRLPVFAFRPAPLQLSWLGYWASTGVSAIDVVLADPLCVPPGEEHQFTEEIWRLPDTRMCFSLPVGAPDVAPLPALTKGHLTFGSFQRLNKITDEALRLWSRVLAMLPEARLRVQVERLDLPGPASRFTARLERAGIDPRRVDLRGQTSRGAYLRAYGEVDVILDTFPFAGGTTTCEALWMGVPTLTLAGHSMVSRQGSALMTLVGLGDWVAADGDAFAAFAAGLRNRLPALATLRAELRGRSAASPLFDAPRFAHALASALRSLHARHGPPGGPDVA